MSIYRLIKYGFVTLLILINALAFGQERNSPKLIKSKDEFIHSSTGTIFPEQIEGYQRKNIYSFSKQDDNIETTYESRQDVNKTTISIKVYPAGDGTEGRLRNEYLMTLKAIINPGNRIRLVDQKAVRRKGNKYICNGFQATLNTEGKSESNELILFECGSWFVRIRISSNELDSKQIQELEEKVINKFDPTVLTEVRVLNLKSDLLIAPALGKDRDRAKFIIKSALRKLEWANDNVPENERVSGFPDLYLNMHIEAFQEFVACKVENDKPVNDIAKLINDINTVIKAGYLPEFIMKQYSMVMIVPDKMKFDFEGYGKFAKENNNPSIDMSRSYYLIVYRQK
jgi:hypothetical protein